MRLVCSLAVCCVLLSPSISLASYEPSDISSPGESVYQCLAQGIGMLEPPYFEEFQWMLVYEPGYLHFVFSHPLDPGEVSQVNSYQAAHELDWSVCWLGIGDETWTAISMPVAGDTQKLPKVFLNHLRHLSFIKILD